MLLQVNISTFLTQRNFKV